MTPKITGMGAYLPDRVMTNEELSLTLDTSDEWIFTHSGIHSRHIADASESTSTMAAEAGRRALAAAGADPSEITEIILATTSADYHPLPATACIVQHALGCANAYAYDLQAACSGFVFALEQARASIALHKGGKILVIGAETLSRIVDWNDRATCILFGDGAGAAVVEPSAEDPAFATKAFLRADGSGAEMIYIDGGYRNPRSGEPRVDPVLHMNGRAVFAFAVKAMPHIVERLCADAGIAPADIDLVVPHQANIRIIESAAKRLGLPMDKFFTNIETVGNTSGASIPVAMAEAIAAGRLKPGMKVCLAGFGGGLTYGGILSEWPYL